MEFGGEFFHEPQRGHGMPRHMPAGGVSQTPGRMCLCYEWSTECVGGVRPGVADGGKRNLVVEVPRPGDGDRPSLFGKRCRCQQMLIAPWHSNTRFGKPPTAGV